jgi:hypothetical protein
MPALPALPTPPAGQPDPRDATYWATAAELGHQYENTLAGNAEALANDKTNLVAGQGKLDRAEPLALTNIRNRANSEGLLSSGIEQQRTGTQQGAYVGSRSALGTGFQQQSNRIARSNSEAGTNYADKGATALAAAEARASEEARLTAEKAPTLGAPPPAPSAAPIPPQIVGQRPQPVSGSQAIRKAAAKRVTRR